ncbi:MAG: phosphomannomutase/phosphoglucomutase [Actinomycetota bacterium]|jgi:phosphomannomutase|nr:phosphomannomutase/phosphoglucomutase [Actinomycetota bacterium]
MSTPAWSSIFKAYDVRGIVPDQLDAKVAWAVGVGFGRFVQARDAATKGIVAGRDMRESGPELARALMAGAASTGLSVTDIGLCSTDLLYFAAGHLDRPGAMLTASHNPARYNGIKLCLAGAAPVGEESGLSEIRAIAEEAYADAPDRPGEGLGVETRDLLSAFAEHVHGFVELDALAPLRIVADTANGMGGLVCPKVFAGLPFHLEVLFGELDGTFPNHPADPIQIENLAALQARVLETGADVGLAFDGDADRVFLVDEKAQPLSGSTTTAIVAKAMLDKHPGATILHNCICSHSVPEIVRENGGIPVRTRVGHSFIKGVMAETGAVFGGEHSGHYYFKDNFRADSGIIAAIVVLEVLSRSRASLSELRKPYERYADSGEINTEVADPKAVVAAVGELVASRGATVDYFDGLTADFGGWWFNLRPSNTEPLLRLNVEASDAPACAERVQETLGLVRELGGETAEA